MIEKPLNAYSVQIVFADKALKALWDIISKKLDDVIESRQNHNRYRSTRMNASWLKDDVAVYMGDENKVIVSSSSVIGKKSFSFWRYVRRDENLTTEMLQAIAAFNHNYGLHHLRQYLKTLTMMIRNCDIDIEIRDRLRAYTAKVKEEKEKKLAVIAKKIKFKKRDASFVKIFPNGQLKLRDCDEDGTLTIIFGSDECLFRAVLTIKIHVDEFDEIAKHFYPIAKYIALR